MRAAFVIVVSSVLASIAIGVAAQDGPEGATTPREAARVEALVHVLESAPSAETRVGAAGSLGRVGGDAALDALVVALSSDPAASVRLAAARALRHWSSTGEACEALRFASTVDDARAVRRLARRMLGHCFFREPESGSLGPLDLP